MSLFQTEAEIRDEIYEYLQKSGIFAWRDKQNYRKGRATFRLSSGVADILGVCRGRAFAIEVKKEKGVLSHVQREWLMNFHLAGGYAGIAHSLDEAIHLLYLWGIHGQKSE